MHLKHAGRVLMRFNELRDHLHLRLAGEVRFQDDELEAAIRLLMGQGVVWELEFGSWVLLQPEWIGTYASAVIQTMREDRLERGCISEDRVLAGTLSYRSPARLPADEERIVLLAVYQTMVQRAMCLRTHTAAGTQLIFPSYYRRERQELTGEPATQIRYRFEGSLDGIHASLVVRLQHCETIESGELWRDAADFETPSGKRLGMKLTRLGEDTGELEVYFDPSIPIEEKIRFSWDVYDHLIQKAQNVLRVPLCDDIEQYFAGPEAEERDYEIQQRRAYLLDNEIRERVLVGEVISTVVLAGQLCREKSVSDHGIDMEIEFEDDNDEPTGQLLYLQLESGDAYRHWRNSDGEDFFEIAKEHYAEYWQAQPFPVLFVARGSDGVMYWMDVRADLRRRNCDGANLVRSIVLLGERFDVMSVRRWRDKMLGTGPERGRP